VEFDRAPFGILGFETALALALEQLVHSGRLSLMRMVELFTAGPARVLGVESKIAAGKPLTSRFFPSMIPDIQRKGVAQQSRNSPFDGRTFKGAPVATIVAGASSINARK